MARMARVVIPFIPHHVTQRGNRRQRTFFSDQDYSFYKRLLEQAAEKAAVDVWAYCLKAQSCALCSGASAERQSCPVF